MAAPKGNKNALGNNGGHPPIFKSPVEMQAKAEEYFTACRENEEPLTVCGLALALGFCDRQSLYDYQAKVEFSGLIKRLRAVIEEGYEKRLHGNSPTGAIFALKNMGWKDKTEHEHTGDFHIVVNDGSPGS